MHCVPTLRPRGILRCSYSSRSHISSCRSGSACTLTPRCVSRCAQGQRCALGPVPNSYFKRVSASIVVHRHGPVTSFCTTSTPHEYSHPTAETSTASIITVLRRRVRPAPVAPYMPVKRCRLSYTSPCKGISTIRRREFAICEALRHELP